jgi:N-acyl-D-aspartate/D-glutamate deacylase
LEGIGEAIETAGLSGAKLHISHLKAAGEKNWGLQSEALAMVEQAQANGLEVTFDVYPYTLTGSVLYTLLPDWVSEGGKRQMLGRLKDPGLRPRIIGEMKKSGVDYAKMAVSVSGVGKELKRKKIIELALSQEKSVEECILDVLVASEGRVTVTAEVLSEENVSEAVRHPFSIVSSNGSGYDLGYKKSGDLVHPRNFGSFPRALRQFVREKKVLSWEEAIHKMTGKPAGQFGLEKRGVLQKGNWADVAVLDPKTISDKATAEDPFQYSEGVSWLVINGEIVLQKGSYNGRRVGRVIRRERSFFGEIVRTI